jgi:hypothetical protein
MPPRIVRSGPLVLMLLLGACAMPHAIAQPAQFDPTRAGSVCPLSEAQTRRSIEAFARIVPTFTREPRCVNCHGGIDPFSDAVSGTQSDPAAPRSEHGGGRMPAGADCSECHNGMLPKRDGSPSKWSLPSPAHAFIGKDGPTLCKQMKASFNFAKDFVGHLTDDNGNSNFTGTAFVGNRGLTPAEQGANFTLQPPRGITAGALVALARDWVAAMGGEFKGDVDCGCEPLHYAVRVSGTVQLDIPGTVGIGTVPPVDVPITFRDDGRFEGDAVLMQGGTAATEDCSGQTAGRWHIRVSGTSEQQGDAPNRLQLKLENASGMESERSGRCQSGSFAVRDQSTGPGAVSFDFVGRVGETVLQVFTPEPEVRSTVRLELVKQR